MRISASQLRQLIREEVTRLKRRRICEASSGSLPSTFKEYRMLFGRALRTAGAPKKMIDNVLDTSREGGPYFDPLWQAWEQWESEDIDQTDEGWEQHIRYYVHDAVIEMYTINGTESDEDFALAESAAKTVMAVFKDI